MVSEDWAASRRDVRYPLAAAGSILSGPACGWHRFARSNTVFSDGRLCQSPDETVHVAGFYWRGEPPTLGFLAVPFNRIRPDANARAISLVPSRLAVAHTYSVAHPALSFPCWLRKSTDHGASPLHENRVVDDASTRDCPRTWMM